MIINWAYLPLAGPQNNQRSLMQTTPISGMKLGQRSDTIRPPSTDITLPWSSSKLGPRGPHRLLSCGSPVANLWAHHLGHWFVIAFCATWPDLVVSMRAPKGGVGLHASPWCRFALIRRIMARSFGRKWDVSQERDEALESVKEGDSLFS